MKPIKYLQEFFSTIGSKSDKKFEEPTDFDDTNILPANEEPELPLLDSNSVICSIDFNKSFSTIKELVRTYRNVALDHTIESAIDQIVNECVVVEDNKNNIALNLDSAEGINDSTKETITKEFNEILNILNFKRTGSKTFREWYIDGRLWFQIIFKKNESNGIAKVRKLSPLDIVRVKDDEDGNIYYIYKEDYNNKVKRRSNGTGISDYDRKFQEGVKISASNIVFVPSGETDPDNEYYISHLHKSIKPLNQLRLLEDSAVIYRITRAPERRVFYIDVGKLPKTKAENYVKGLMDKFKSSVTYDVTTGKVTQNRNVMTMLEDFYLPTRGDTKGTKVETLEGGQQLGEIEDIRYFKKNVLSSLKVPFSRLDTDEQAMVEIGRTGELSRPELSFQDFVNRLKTDFSILFYELLKVQLIKKNILKIDEWNKIKNDINFVWNTNNYFTELKNNEILSQRLELLDSINDYIGRFYSSDWVKKNVLQQTDAEIKQIEKEISQNKEEKVEDEDDF